MAQKNNKGIIIAVVIVLLLCCCTSAALLGGWYFFFRTTPQSAFNSAADTLITGTFYKFQSNSSLSMSAGGQNTTIDSTSEGEVDIQNKAEHAKTSTTTDGQISESESYTFGNISYESSDTGDFTQKPKSSSADQSNELIAEVAKAEKYTVLSDETIGTVDCYHYKVQLTDDQLKKLADTITESGVEQGYSYSNLKVLNGTLEVWVSKSDETLVKVDQSVEKITTTMSWQEDGQDAQLDVTIDNLNQIVFFKDWGVKVTIEKPV